MSTSTIPTFTCATFRQPHKKQKAARSPLQIRAQGLQDEGKWSSNLVDSNMKLLKDRIEVMKAKERLEQNHSPYGWNINSSNYIKKPKKQPQYLETLALVCGTFSLPILIGTTLLCIFSLIAHLNV